MSPFTAAIGIIRHYLLKWDIFAVVCSNNPDEVVWEHQWMDVGRGVMLRHAKPGNRCVFIIGKLYQQLNNE